MDEDTTNDKRAMNDDEDDTDLMSDLDEEQLEDVEGTMADSEDMETASEE